MQRLTDRPSLTLAVLAVTQLMGWGTLNLPAVIGEQLARDLGLSLTAVFAGTTANLVVMGLTGPLLAGPFVRFGARRLMVVGALVAAPGFLLIASAEGPMRYFAGWVLLGVAGAAMLNTASYILLNEIAGAKARRLIGWMMLSTALSSSVFWPITDALSAAFGWRMAVATYGAAMLFISFPLYFFFLPERRQPAPEAVTAPAAAATAKPRRGPLLLLMGAITLTAVVTWGSSSTLIQLLKTLGTEDAWAVRLASMVGVLQVSARAFDLFAGSRWDGLATGIVGAALLPLSFAVLMIGGSAGWAVATFIIIYGLASGAIAVARATIPLVFYDQSDFARATSHISLPLNLGVAVAPPAFVAVLTTLGVNAMLVLLLGLALLGLAMMLALRRGRGDVAGGPG